MDKPGITIIPDTSAGPGAGAFTTFYAYDNGPARSLVLANMAWMLAGRGPAGMPVLMIDWDLEAPGLHHLFDCPGERPGLLEYMEACRDQLAILAERAGGAHPDDDDLARRVLATVDWHDYVERVDALRPLYLMRAGRCDVSYGERVARLAWDGLFHACPALWRQLRRQLARAFSHVCIDARGGRSAAVSVCTTLLPDRLVGLFTPAQRSLEGLCGVMQRAVAYRCSHEDEQRPLLLYPLPCSAAGVDSPQRRAWRRGAPPATPGYQARLEALMQASYGRPHLSLESYFDAIALHHVEPLADGMHPAVAPDATEEHGSPGRTLSTLLDWCVDGYFPWQSHAELTLLQSIGAALSTDKDEGAPPAQAAAVHPHALRSLLVSFSRECERAAAPRPAAAPPEPAQFPALRPLAARVAAESPCQRSMAHARWDDVPFAAVRSSGAVHRFPFRVDGPGPHDAGRLRQLADAVETQLDHLQQLVDQQALREARPVADSLRQLVLRPAVAHPLRRRGAALIKLVYRHDNDTDALLAFTQDELASLEQVLNEAAAGRPLAFS